MANIDGFDGRAVANFILDVSSQNGREITNLALQKIVYFCHVWSLVLLGRPLIKQEFEAWKHGPVLQYLYHQFKNCDRRPINERAQKLDQATGSQVVVEYRFDSDIESLLHKVVVTYSRFSAGELVEISHEKGGPWDKVWNHQGQVNPGMRICNQEIVDFYSRVKPPFTLQ